MRTRMTALALAAGLSLFGCGHDNPMQSQNPAPLAHPATKPVAPRAVITATLTQNGTPVSGATVALARSIAGLATDYRWSGTTGADGKANVEITTEGDAGGYYLVRATSAAGAMIGNWNSVPINGGYEQMVSLPVGGHATVTEGASLAPKTVFSVRIENITPAFPYTESGVFNTPEGETSAGPAFPGKAFTFSFSAEPGAHLSFATMFAQSNDWFYAPDENGIALWNADGSPVSGDVTSQIHLWDAGTEANQEPGAGSNQAPRQSAPNTGPADPDNTVRMASGFDNIPSVASVIKVTITPNGDSKFTVRIDNVSTTNTLVSSTGPQPIPLSPGVYVVHAGSAPLFQSGQPDRGQGLEAIAEDGNPAALADYVHMHTGVVSPFSPGVFVVGNVSGALFHAGQPDLGQGLEAIAEAGNPSTLSGALSARFGTAAGVFSMPEGASAAGPIVPGSAYTFTFSAEPGAHLTFATMEGQSNDWFFAPGDNGIALWNANGSPVSGDITSQISLWDAGTEVNQPLGVGKDQGPRQSGPNVGAPDPNNAVRIVSDPSGRTPAVNQIMRVTITPQM